MSGYMQTTVPQLPAHRALTRRVSSVVTTALNTYPGAAGAAWEPEPKPRPDP